MTKRDKQTWELRSLKTAVQLAYHSLIDELARLDGHPADIATAAFRMLPNTIGALTETIQKRRELWDVRESLGLGRTNLPMGAGP
jgi:hypothetical protein